MKGEMPGNGNTHQRVCMYTLCFTDDQVVLAQDEDGLGYMVRKLREEYEKVGL